VQPSTGEADDIQCHALIEYASAGETNDKRFAPAVDELTGNIHSLSVASTDQVLTGDVTLAGVPIPMDILFERDVWITDMIWEELMYEQVLPPTLAFMVVL
jgi:hypothetical protein